MGKERAAKAVMVIIALTALSKVTGFIREMVVAAHLGAGAATDAYLTAALVLTLLLNILGGRSIGTSFIPVYWEVSAAGDHRRVEKFTGTVLALTFFLFSLAALAGFIFAPLLVSAIAPGLSFETKELTVFLTRMLLTGLPLLALSGLVAALLNIHNNFAAPAAMGIPLNLSIIGALLFSAIRPVAGLIAGTLTGYLAQVILGGAALKRKKIRFFSGADFREPGLARVGKLLLPILAGGAIIQFNPVVNRVLASGLPEGTISALNYADRIIQVALEFLVATVITVSYPAMSKAYAGGGRAVMNDLVDSWAGVLLFITVPAALAIAFLSKPLVQVLYERGAFNSEASAATAVALLFYSLGLPFVALGRFLARVFYTVHDSRTPVVIGIIVAIINILFCLVLVKPLGHRGLALASSCSAAALVVISILALRAKTGYVFGRGMGKKILCILAATAAAAIVMAAVSAMLGGDFSNGLRGRLIYLIVVGGSGMLFYICSAYLLKLEEVMAAAAIPGKLISFLRRN